MEEILASIRQIIADDPKSDRPAPVVETSSPVPPPSPVAAKADTPKPIGSGPLADRLSGVLKNGALPPTSPLGSKRPLSFDQDLADMFDEQSPSDAASAPKPDMRAAPGFTSALTNGSKPTSTAPFDTQKPADVSPVLPPPFTPSSTSSSPPSFGSSSGSSEAKSETPAPPRTFGFPPLRKQGFFPPQSTPSLPPISGEPPRNGVAAAPASSAPSSGSASDGMDVLSGISGLGAVVPGESAAAKSAGNGLFGAPAFSTSAMQSPRTSETSFKGSTEAREVEAEAVPSLSTPASFKETVADPIAEVSKPSSAFDAKPSPIPAPMASVTDVSFEPAPFASLDAAAPIGAGSHSTMGRAEPRFAAEPAPSTVAAQALDALAQGLAASAAASAVSAATAQQAVPLTPVIDPEPARRDVPGSAALPVAAPQGGTGRTLEDAVADMLRPMLQQWVSDNMPRIIERALRVEVAKTTKPGSNS